MTSNNDIALQLNRIENRLTDLEHAVTQTKGVVEAWATVKNGGTFLKWVAGLLSPIGALYVYLKTGVTPGGHG